MRTFPPRKDGGAGRTPPPGTAKTDPGRPLRPISRNPATEALTISGQGDNAWQHPTSRSARPAQATKHAPRTDQRILLTLDQVLAELGSPNGPLPRSTWHDWQNKGTGPKVIKLPNGQIRVARDDLNTWLDGLTRDPATP